MYKLTRKIINRIKECALKVHDNSDLECVNYEIMVSKNHKKTLILRWITVDISNPDRPVQHYRYECLDLKGNPLGCSIFYANQEEANAFFESLVPLKSQEYSVTKYS